MPRMKAEKFAKFLEDFEGAFKLQMQLLDCLRPWIPNHLILVRAIADSKEDWEEESSRLLRPGGKNKQTFAMGKIAQYHYRLQVLEQILVSLTTRSVELYRSLTHFLRSRVRSLKDTELTRRAIRQ